MDKEIDISLLGIGITRYLRCESCGKTLGENNYRKLCFGIYCDDECKELWNKKKIKRPL